MVDVYSFLHPDTITKINHMRASLVLDGQILNVANITRHTIGS